jgi:glutaredoxin-like protein
MMEKLLKDEIVRAVGQVFEAQLKQPVELLYFAKKDNCETCDSTRQLLEEVVTISDKLHLSTYDLDDNTEDAIKYNVNMAPELVIAGREGDTLIDYGIRMAGIPSGYEFSSLIQDIIMVSGRDSGLKPNVRQALKNLKKPVHLQVFVTPT